MKEFNKKRFRRSYMFSKKSEEMKCSKSKDNYSGKREGEKRTTRKR